MELDVHTPNSQERKIDVKLEQPRASQNLKQCMFVFKEVLNHRSVLVASALGTLGSEVNTHSWPRSQGPSGRLGRQSCCCQRCPHPSPPTPSPGHRRLRAKDASNTLSLETHSVDTERLLRISNRTVSGAMKTALNWGTWSSVWPGCPDGQTGGPGPQKDRR